MAPKSPTFPPSRARVLSGKRNPRYESASRRHTKRTLGSSPAGDEREESGMLSKVESRLSRGTAISYQTRCQKDTVLSADFLLLSEAPAPLSKGSPSEKPLVASPTGKKKEELKKQKYPCRSS